jgi:hypothetical protein
VRRVHQSILQTRLSLAAEPTQQQILLLAMETKPLEENDRNFWN